MPVLFALTGLLSLAGMIIALIGVVVQAIRKRKIKIWVIVLIGCIIAFLVSFAVTPTPDETESKAPVVDETQQTGHEDITQSSESENTATEDIEKTEAEKFAEENNTSVELAESLETVLTGMELTDSSKVGVFHYNLSHVYEWKQIDDWAEGERYSAYMDLEHVWYIYVKGDTVVGVRDGHGNIFYSE